MAFLGKRYFSGEPFRIPKHFDLLDGCNEMVWWPKCVRCTERDRYSRGRTIPVETYDVHDEPPRSRSCKKDIIVRCECHGEKQSARIEVPYWWSDGMCRAAIAHLKMFGVEKPDDGLVKFIGKG